MTRQALFDKKDWKMHSGGIAHYKIECDALTDADVDCLAFMIAQKGKIKAVHGVPRGGIRLERALQQYVTPHEGVRLIIDDVLTTGTSMEEAKRNTGWSDAIGIVIFARSHYPSWIHPVFEMRWINTKDEF